MAKELYINIGSVLKTPDEIYINVANAIRKGEELYMNVGGVIKSIWKGTVPAGQVVFTSSQAWTVPDGVKVVDIFCVGGGGGGVNRSGTSVFNGYPLGHHGGSGGKTKAIFGAQVIPGASYSVIVGAGSTYPLSGNSTIVTGGTSSFGSLCSAGGGQGTDREDSEGGSGGGRGGFYPEGRGGNGGYDGSNGYENVDVDYPRREGQGTTTRAFAESQGTLYAGGGGGGGSHNWSGTTALAQKGVDGAGGGAPNTGGGGYGATWYKSGDREVKEEIGIPGYSGIVILRWAEQ